MTTKVFWYCHLQCVFQTSKIISFSFTDDKKEGEESGEENANEDDEDGDGEEDSSEGNRLLMSTSDVEIPGFLKFSGPGIF